MQNIKSNKMTKKQSFIDREAQTVTEEAIQRLLELSTKTQVKDMRRAVNRLLNLLSKSKWQTLPLYEIHTVLTVTDNINDDDKKETEEKGSY